MTYEELVKVFSERLSSQRSGKTIGLVGGLGLGKTHLVKAILSAVSEELGKQVASPTFNLCNRYSSETIEIHHYDLYRLESEEELYDTGIMDSLENEGVTIFIEWIDMFPMLADHCDQIVTISLNEHGDRDYSVDDDQ